MNKFLANLQYQAEENPVLAMGVAAGLLGAVSQLINATSKLVNAHSGARNSKSWDRETARRAMKEFNKK